MTDELEDLYQDIILDHNRRPANFRPMAHADRAVEADNPLCGDRLTLFLKLEDGRVADIAFQGAGCAISMASASLLTERIKGATVSEAEQLFEIMHRVLTGSARPEDAAVDLGSLAALSGVRRYPMRVKCATLSWHALKAALDGSDGDDIVSTE
jgi:nitrogen fixation NifU-like protein